MSYESAHRPIFSLPEQGLTQRDGPWVADTTPAPEAETDTRTPQELHDALVFSLYNAHDVGDKALIEEYEDMLAVHLAKYPELRKTN